MQTKFHPVNRDRLFFDQYRYSICFVLEEASCLRAPDSQTVLKNIEWRNHSRQRWNHGQGTIEPAIVTNLMHMWDQLDPSTSAVKFTVSFNRVYVYGHDPVVLGRIACQDYTNVLYAQEALITRPRDIVVKKNPAFCFRSYFRDKSLELDQAEKLRNFLTSRREIYGFTECLKQHMERRYKWFYLQRYEWIEHNSMADLTMLSLICPGIIRKTVPVVAK
jgi:hypothetical protein